MGQHITYPPPSPYHMGHTTCYMYDGKVFFFLLEAPIPSSSGRQIWPPPWSLIRAHLLPPDGWIGLTVFAVKYESLKPPHCGKKYAHYRGMQ